MFVDLMTVCIIFFSESCCASLTELDISPMDIQKISRGASDQSRGRINSTSLNHFIGEASVSNNYNITQLCNYSNYITVYRGLYSCIVLQIIIVILE